MLVENPSASILSSLVLEEVSEGKCGGRGSCSPAPSLPGPLAVNLRLASARWVPKARIKQKSVPLPEVIPHLEVVPYPACNPGDFLLVWHHWAPQQNPVGWMIALSKGLTLSFPTTDTFVPKSKTAWSTDIASSRCLSTGGHRMKHAHGPEKLSASIWPGHLRASVRIPNAVIPAEQAWTLRPGLALSLYIPGLQGRC